jgi:hypothetical protein
MFGRAREHVYLLACAGFLVILGLDSLGLIHDRRGKRQVICIFLTRADGRRDSAVCHARLPGCARQAFRFLQTGEYVRSTYFGVLGREQRAAELAVAITSVSGLSSYIQATGKLVPYYVLRRMHTTGTSGAAFRFYSYECTEYRACIPVHLAS